MKCKHVVIVLPIRAVLGRIVRSIIADEPRSTYSNAGEQWPCGVIL